MNPVQLAFRVLRVDSRTRTSTILTALGVAVATGLVLLLISLPYATQARAERSIWQERSPSHGETTTMLRSVSDDFTGGTEITRLDLASTVDASTIALPKGMPKFPAPGEVLVSPSLFERMHALPADRLADRFQGKVVGTLSEDALKYPDQLVAVVGHTPEDMPYDADETSGFTPANDAEADPFLGILAGVGVVVLLVPSLVLVASSSRLTAARRERRLAALRLAGATPGQVTGIVAAETGVAAVAGALLGLAVKPLLAALCTNVPWDGGTWLYSDFAMPVGVTVALVVAMPVLVLLAAVLGLRRVVRNPVGAVSGHSPKPLKAWRLLALPITAGVFFVAVSSEHASAGFVLLALFLLVASAIVVGPWVTFAVGRFFVGGWRKPSGLLAGRRLLDDPRGAYRASAGVVLAVFVGSMALTLMPSFESTAGGGGTYRDSVLSVTSTPERAGATVDRIDAQLAKTGQHTQATEVGQVMLSSVNGSKVSALVVDCAKAERLLRISVSCKDKPAVYGEFDLDGYTVSDGYGSSAGVPLPAGTPTGTLTPNDSDASVEAIIDPGALPAGVQSESVDIAVPTDGADPEVVRTALAAGGDSIYSRDEYLVSQQTELADLRRVTIIGVVAAAVLAGCSAAIATAGSVMDRRRTFGALMAAGTPVRVLSKALRAEAALPALAATIGAGAIGMGAGLGLFSMVERGKDVSAVLTPWLLAPVVLGLGVAVLAASVCTPALKRVQAEPLADE
ncbi:FtsX-like permease family protein [Amycolatopsis acidicola]|uniref:FtsX-like permease family protein n=1 Tax=Amycolatopsis acidicola TaxID=2596893 RepID=A0A5N0UP94_9PSEU|nr:FtsX-like permease family protein [Amycolatopsis acidicola]KAA9151905.1 FtsX-like permease family protein [Amycolatopsis acidicola]